MRPVMPAIGRSICLEVKLKEIQIIEWGMLDYATALDRQRQMVKDRIKDRSPDRLLLVEHPPVVTIGRSGSLNDLHVSKAALEKRGVGLQQVERGGRATFHGPGQLVAYPIVKVADKDLHAFLKQLIDTAADLLRSYGLDPEFLKAEPGV
jgi:lipoic acid synthetase